MTDQPDERPETEEFVFDTEKEIETARKEESRKKTEVYSTISHDDAFEVTVPQEEEVYDAPNAVEKLKQPGKHPTAEKVEAIKDALKYFGVII